MGVTERAVERSLASKQSRYQEEVKTLVEAGERVLRRKGFHGATVSDILEEAGLSSRAFYRHFPSKAELMLALFERDAEQTATRLRERLDRLDSPDDQLVAWIEDVLSLAYAPRRARRTQLFMSHAAALRSLFPSEMEEISAAPFLPLIEILERGKRTGDFPEANPALDARSVFAVTWSLAEARVSGGGPASLEDCRDYILRFCGPALGRREVSK